MKVAEVLDQQTLEAEFLNDAGFYYFLLFNVGADLYKVYPSYTDHN